MNKLKNLFEKVINRLNTSVKTDTLFNEVETKTFELTAENHIINIPDLSIDELCNSTYTVNIGTNSYTGGNRLKLISPIRRPFEGELDGEIVVGCDYGEILYSDVDGVFSSPVLTIVLNTNNEMGRCFANSLCFGFSYLYPEYNIFLYAYERTYMRELAIVFEPGWYVLNQDFEYEKFDIDKYPLYVFPTLFNFTNIQSYASELFTVNNTITKTILSDNCICLDFESSFTHLFADCDVSLYKEAMINGDNNCKYAMLYALLLCYVIFAYNYNNKTITLNANNDLVGSGNIYPYVSITCPIRKIKDCYIPKVDSMLDISGASTGDVIVVSEVNEDGVPQKFEAKEIDATLGIKDAEVGQAVIIQEVDENGVPIKFNSIDTKYELRDFILLKDSETNYKYIVEMKNGSLVSSVLAKSITITTMPNKVTYTEGDIIDVTGMVVTAAFEDGSAEIIEDYTYNNVVGTDGLLTVSWKQTGFEFSASVELDVTLASEILVDFEYTDNGDGTYTLTGWKGTLNGEPSTEIIVPDYEFVVL